MLKQLRSGVRYRVTHQLETQGYPRESVMVYLGQNQWGERQFNARPVAGTQTLADKHILGVYEVPKGTEPYVGRRARWPVV